jgi:hypothetical protein
MSITRRDTIVMEKPYWLTQMHTVLEGLNEGVAIATTITGSSLRTRGSSIWPVFPGRT